VTKSPKRLLALAVLLGPFVGCASGPDVVSKTDSGVNAAEAPASSVPSGLPGQSVVNGEADRQAFSSLKELAQQSVAVLTGRVTAAGAAYVLDGTAVGDAPGVVVTPFTFSIDSVVAGDPTLFAKTATFAQRGGATPQVTTDNGDDAPVKVGERLLVFVAKVTGSDIEVWQAGRFTIDGDRIVAAAAEKDGASVELKSKPLSAVAGLVRAQLGKKPPIEAPAIPQTTLPVGKIIVAKAPTPPTSAP
jgi:hypothetical protein